MQVAWMPFKCGGDDRKADDRSVVRQKKIKSQTGLVRGTAAEAAIAAEWARWVRCS